MRTILTLISAMVAVGCLAQEPAVPTERILPDDIEQDSIRLWGSRTNHLAVFFTFTEVGAKKALAFRREHAGHEVLMQVGNYERRITIAPLETRPTGWTEEGWLKRRTDKIFVVSEDDANKVIEALRKK